MSETYPKLVSADEPGIEPVRVGDRVRVQYDRRKFQLMTNSTKGTVVEIEENLGTMLIRPTNPFREAKQVWVSFRMVKVWRGKDGERWLNPTMREEEEQRT